MKPVNEPQRRARHRALGGCAAITTVLLAAGLLTGCTWVRDTVPRCGDYQRLAILAQSVPTATYVPCIEQLPQGWHTSVFDPAQGGTRFLLESDRAPGAPVVVRLRSRCSVAGASPTTPRAAGVLTYMRLVSVSPSYTGTLLDVFPGGCVAYGFDFEGPYIALMDEFESAVGLYPRQQLRLDLRKKLGVELDP